MSVAEQFVLFLASFVANWFSALSGGGAGLIQFPMLIFLGLPFGVALATHKVASVALGLGATVRHWRESHLERRFSLIILAAGLPGVQSLDQACFRDRHHPDRVEADYFLSRATI